MSIGDPDESITAPKNSTKKEWYNFPEDFRKHLGLLLVGTKIPKQIVENWDTVESFGAASIKKDNQPRRYYFYCGYGRSFPNSVIISGPTFRSIEVMRELKKLLSEENWVGDNVIETPLRGKLDKNYYDSDRYIQHIVSEALDAAWKRLFTYIYYLQNEHLKKNKKL